MDKNRIVKNSKFWAATVTVAACVALSACSDAASSNRENTTVILSEDADSSEPENTDIVRPESADSSKPEIADSVKPENTDSAKPESTESSKLESTDSAQPDKIEIPNISTGYPEYDALLAQVQKVLVDPDCYLTEELEDRFSFTFYFLAFYQDYDSPGYILLDLDGNGTEELILGENGGGAWDGVIFDIYTVVDGELNHVFAGGERNQCHLCEDGTIAYECTNGASDSAHIYYTYEAAELKMIEAVHYYEDGIYYSTEHSFTGYLIGEIEPETYRKYEWEEEDREEVEKIHEKYVYGPIPFNRLIVTSQEK